MPKNAFWRMTIWIGGLAVSAAIGTMAGLSLASTPDQRHLFKGVGALCAACAYTWSMLKLFGPPGPDRQ